MTTDPNTASIDQCRDWIAENVLGWTPPGSFSYHRHEWERDNENQGTDKLDEGVHPMGTDKGTDAAIAAMPKGWWWSLWVDNDPFVKGRGICPPCPQFPSGTEAGVSSDDDKDELEQRQLAAWRLCLAMHIAEGRGK